MHVETAAKACLNLKEDPIASREVGQTLLQLCGENIFGCGFFCVVFLHRQYIVKVSFTNITWTNFANPKSHLTRHAPIVNYVYIMLELVVANWFYPIP